MLNPQRLTVLRELAQRGSFTAAADALSYTQSAVSQQISALERETGALLVERDRKRARAWRTAYWIWPSCMTSSRPPAPWARSSC